MCWILWRAVSEAAANLYRPFTRPIPLWPDTAKPGRSEEHPMSSEQRAGLDRQFVEQQRERLLALRKQLLGGEEDNLARERTFQQEHGEEAEEEEERAQTSSQLEIDQALHDVDDRRIANIDRALQKIAEGSYGLSDLSGEAIPRARLEVTPEALFTVQEESRAEKDRAR
jgi:DnaK suppressor protein